MHPLADLQRFTGALTMSKMEESKEAERLPEVLGRVPDALPLATSLINKDVSAAYGTLSRLAKIRRSPEYVTAFRDLVEVIGLQACGWCLDKLPAMNSDDARRHIDAALDIARRYGAVAGQAYLEGKTKP
jgi:hypothetical protein